jgi:4-amino-4-deoxy-L-arabinose transferase-like glycosyltransferase
VLLAGWCAFLFLYGIDAGPLYRTESLRAIIGRECLHGHWLYPVLYGEPFLTKPPGHYAAIGLCSLPFDEVSAATARLPSVLAAALAVVLMHGMFRRVLGDSGAVLIALLLPCSVLWLDKVPSAEIDMTLVGWVTAAIVLLYRAIEGDTRTAGAGIAFWVASLLCVAAGTLTKWTAPAFFYLTAIPLLAWRGQLRLLIGRGHLLAVGVAALVCAGWASAVVQQVGWDSLSETIRREAAYRFAPKANRGYPLGDVALYPLAVFAAHLPVSAFALLTFRKSFWTQWDDRGRLLLQLLHCWTWPNLLFWTLVPNHNVRYVLPISAGLMGLGVMGMLSLWRPHPPTPSPQRGGGEAPDFSPSPCGGGGWGVGSLLPLFLLCWLVAKVAFVQVVIPGRTAGRNAEGTAAELRGHVPAGEPLYVLKLKDEGVTFYYGRPVVRLKDPASLPPGGCALLIRPEWQARAAFGPLEVLCCMNDQQGDPIYLVRKAR